MKKSGFTLAEVLITLGIIGVVAAMTLPAMIQNYKKREVESRLKYTYALLTEVFKRAEADYGEPKYWEAFSTGEKDSSRFNEERKAFVKKYMLPYLSGAEFIENKKTSDVGYKEGWKNPNGTILVAPNNVLSFLRIKNGIIMQIVTGIVKNSQNKNIISSIAFYFDVNGTEKPNIVGKDIFVINLIPSSGQIIMKGEIARFNLETGLPGTGTGAKPQDRQEFIDNCKRLPDYCGALIKHDGWEFKKDYPYPW